MHTTHPELHSRDHRHSLENNSANMPFRWWWWWWRGCIRSQPSMLGVWVCGWLGGWVVVVVCMSIAIAYCHCLSSLLATIAIGSCW